MLLDRESSAQAGAVRKGTFSVGARQRTLCSGACRYCKLSSGLARLKVPCSVGAGLRTPFALRPSTYSNFSLI
jgi:hypothetical protein